MCLDEEIKDPSEANSPKKTLDVDETKSFTSTKGEYARQTASGSVSLLPPEHNLFSSPSRPPCPLIRGARRRLPLPMLPPSPPPFNPCKHPLPPVNQLGH